MLHIEGETISIGQVKMPCPGYYIDQTGTVIYLDKDGKELPSAE